MPSIRSTSQLLVHEVYGQRLRVRVCGLLREGDNLLMVKHWGVGTAGSLWSPPGGGVEFGEPASTALKREFLEETGLIIDATRLLFVNELIALPLHAIELFFDVQRVGGIIGRGIDPETNKEEQLILDVRFMPFEEIKELPANEVHHLFAGCQSLDEVFSLTGYRD
ncbi:NUDIX domain-containing protein [Fibrella arboris]|uniref:NUDIX domain-containing protein n=1 Tax=Fibrella arboris TaxID=3242486 RepID=UPI003520F5ED